MLCLAGALAGILLLHARLRCMWTARHAPRGGSMKLRLLFGSV